MGVDEGPEAGVLEAAGAGDHRTAVVPGPEVHWGQHDIFTFQGRVLALAGICKRLAPGTPGQPLNAKQHKHNFTVGQNQHIVPTNN